MSDKPRGLRSGELARAAGVSTDTLRHYERLGVLAEAPRTLAGYRVYPAESLDRVNMIRHALRLGFTLAELAEVLRARHRGGVPCKQVLGMLEGKVESLGKQISDLKRLEKYMEQIVGDWRSKLGQSEPGKRVHLLHSLMAAPVPGATNSTLQRRRKQR
jgi:DNA-binding transcriptional MerR regulator